MNEIQQNAEPARPAATAGTPPPPITSLRGYWVIVLPLIALAAQFVIGLIVGFMFAAVGTTGASSPLLVLIAIAGLAALSYFVIVYVLLSVRRWRWRDLGFKQSPVLPVIVAIGVGLVTAVLARLFELAAQPAEASLFRKMSGFELAATSLVIGTLVPIAEETMFRGVVFPVLRARIGNTLGAVIVSALIFGGFHLYPLQIVVGCVLGLPLAWLRHWSGSLVAPIALHMTHNLCVVLIAALRII